MGLSSVYSVLALFSLISLYHASMHNVCPNGYYCAATNNCKNESNCQKGVCPAGGDISLIRNWTDTCDTGPDDGKPTLAFSMRSFSGNEGEEAIVKLLLDKPLDCCTVSVRVEFASIDAEAGDDFEDDPKLIVFPAGQTTAEFKVKTIDDNIFEGSETFRVMIMAVSVPYGVELGSVRSAIVTILDNDDASIRFADRALEVSEKDGTVNATVELVGGIVSSRDITVLVETTSNTATDCDYAPGPYLVIIPALKPSTHIAVRIIDDNLYEFSEIFQLAFMKETLEPSQRIEIIGNGASVTISDDEGPNFVSFDKKVYRVEEGNTSVMPILLLDKPPTCCITIRARLDDYNVSNESNHMDYSHHGQILTYTFLTNQTRAFPDVNISIFHDFHPEDHEAFCISIINRSLPFGVEARTPKAVILIEDDDNHVSFSTLEYEVYEDKGPVIVTLKLHRPALERIEVGVSATSLTATGNGVDYYGLTFLAIFEQNETQSTISIDINNDTRIEEDLETFRLDIYDFNFPKGFIKYNPHMAYVNILDDDFECEFNKTADSVNEGDYMDLQLSLSRNQRRGALDVEYIIRPSSTATEGDVSFSKKEGKIQGSDVIRIFAVTDTVLEAVETIAIAALIKDDREVTCSTTFDIVDGNMCKFDQSSYSVEEGDKVDLFLSLTTPLPADVNIRMEYNYSEAMSNDLSMSPPSIVKFPGGDEVVKITLDTERDISIEKNESFEVIAYPPSDANIHCRTTVTIIDDNMCSFGESQYTVTEGRTTDLTLKLDKSLPVSINAQIQFDTEDIYLLRGTNNRISIGANRDEAKFAAFAKPNDFLEREMTHTITARLPGGRECSTELRIIDDDSIKVYFRDQRYTLVDKNDVRKQRPYLDVMGKTGFSFNVTVLELDGTATGYDGDEPKLFKDFERRNHVIEITPEKTENRFASFRLPVDVIDDDIVERRNEYYTLKIINTTLPQRVTITRYPTTRVEITDDDETTIRVDGSNLKLSKGLYTDVRVRFTFKDGQQDEYRDLIAPDTSMELPDYKANIQRILVYLPYVLRGCRCVHEDDEDNLIMIMHENS